MFVWNFFDADARVMRECTALAESGYDVRLIALYNPDDPDCLREEDKNGFHITRVTSKRKTGGGSLKKHISELRGIINMIKAARRYDYDVFHANDLNTLPQAYVCARMRFKKSKRQRIVYDSHEVQTSRMGYYGKLAHMIERFFIRKVSVIINTNDARADYTVGLYGIKKPYVLHNYPAYVPYEKIVERRADLHGMLDIPAGERILLYQGGIQAGRGLDKLLEAAGDFTDGVVLLVGDGKLKPQLEQYVREHDLSARVRFMDKVPYEKLFGITANAYLGFQLLNNTCFNHYSADSNKLFEYMMCGVPVVACRMPEIERIVCRESCGLVVDEEEPKAIAEAVNALLADNALRDKMAQNALNGINDYIWENEKNTFVEMYNGLFPGEV
jgi:glycosyltransferase involved in cell wall biosynthesis